MSEESQDEWRDFALPPYFQGYYWVYASPCCQNPPSCGCFHGPPRWSIEFISQHGVYYKGEYHPLDEFVGHIGERLEEPTDKPSEDGWDCLHYTTRIC